MTNAEVSELADEQGSCDYCNRVGSSPIFRIKKPQHNVEVFYVFKSK